MRNGYNKNLYNTGSFKIKILLLVDLYKSDNDYNVICV